MRLILASTSPRRRDILKLLRVEFDIVAPTFVEVADPARPIADEVLAFARGKAESVARVAPESVVVAGDTMIFLDGEKIGKPDGIADARGILRAFSGKRHRIFTSVVIVDRSGGGLGVVEQVEVEMRPYTDEEVENYLARNEWPDKAGAYSIQDHGRELIASFRGDYLAAVGMPLKPIVGYLAGRGISCGVDIDRLYAEKSFPNWPTY
jgi:septum formation protein